MRVETVKVTPALAAEWFGTVIPEKQRKFRDHHAAKLAAIICRGEFQTNNDMFMFSKRGDLGNGMHRAAAIARSGRAVTVIVAWDCTDDQIKVADQGGLPRHNEDALHYAGVSNARTVSAIINTVVRDVEHERFAPSSTEAIAFAEMHAERLSDAIAIWDRCKSSRSPVEPSIVCAVWFVASQVDRKSADSFAAAVADGIPLMRGDAVWALIKRFKDNKERLSGRMGRDVKVAITIKAYQYWKAGKNPPFLRWSPGQGEDFPAIK